MGIESVQFVNPNNKLPELDINSNFDTRKVDTKFGIITLTKTSVDCCICQLAMWEESRTRATWTNGWIITDPRAYPDNITPDYSYSGKDLLQCHYECYPILKQKMDDKVFEKLISNI